MPLPVIVDLRGLASADLWQQNEALSGRVDWAEPASRRARSTFLCLVDDLDLDLLGLDVDLGEIDDPLLEEVRRLAQTSPPGQRRILSVDRPLVFGQASWLFDLAMR